MLNEQEEDSSEESDIEIVFETQALNNDDLAELRPHDFSLPVSNVSDSTAVKEIEGRGLNVIGEVSDGTGTVDEGNEGGGTVQFGEINDNIVPNVEGQGDGKDEVTEATEVSSLKIATDTVVENQVGATDGASLCRSKRQTAGKHSNIHRLPRSVNQQEVASQKFSVTEQPLADLSQAHRMLVELFAKRH